MLATDVADFDRSSGHPLLLGVPSGTHLITANQRSGGFDARLSRTTFLLGNGPCHDFQESRPSPALRPSSLHPSLPGRSGSIVDNACLSAQSAYRDLSHFVHGPSRPMGHSFTASSRLQAERGTEIAPGGGRPCGKVPRPMAPRQCGRDVQTCWVETSRLSPEMASRPPTATAAIRASSPFARPSSRLCRI